MSKNTLLSGPPGCGKTTIQVEKGRSGEIEEIVIRSIKS
jgi:hypothetical protein